MLTFPDRLDALTKVTGRLSDFHPVQLWDGQVDTITIADAAITTAKIQDAAITNAQIEDATITSAKISDLSADKITAGTLSAAVILSGSIKTATSGARVEIDASGVRLYDASDVLTVELDATDGSAAFKGAISGSSLDAPDDASSGLHVDADGNIGIGGSSSIDGEFQVSAAGAVTMTAVTVSGRVTAGSVAWAGSELGSDDSITMPKAGFATPGAVQQVSNKGLNTSLLGAAAWKSDPVAGNLLVALVAWRDATATITSFTAGWTHEGTDQTNGAMNLAVYTKIAAGGDSAPDVSFVSGPADGVVLITAEFSGIVSASYEDKSATNSGNSGAPSSGTTATTTQDYELWLSFFAQADQDTFSSPTNGFAIYNQTNNAQLTAGLAYAVKTAAAAASCAVTSSRSQLWLGRVITFKASGSAATAPGTPDTDKIVIYARTRGSVAAPAFKTDAGVEVPVGSPVKVRATRITSDQNLTVDTEAAVQFNGEDYDTDTLHDPSTNNSRFTADRDGKWRLAVNVSFTAGADSNGAIKLFIRKNGGATNLSLWQRGGNNVLVTGNTFWSGDLVSGDYLEVIAIATTTDRDISSADGATFAEFEFQGV